MKKAWILSDNTRGNIGDAAAGLNMKKILRQLKGESGKIIPGDFNAPEHGSMMRRRGQFLRSGLEFLNDNFRIPKNYVLHVTGIVGKPQGPDFPNNYHDVAVRRNGPEKNHQKFSVPQKNLLTVINRSCHYCRGE